MSDIFRRTCMILALCCMISVSSLPVSVFAEETVTGDIDRNNVSTAEDESSEEEEILEDDYSAVSCTTEQKESTTVTLTDKKAYINIKKKKLTIDKGKSVKLSYIVLNVSKNQIQWTSSNKKVATVTSSGKVKVKKGGKATITARIRGTDVKDTINIVGRRCYRIRVRTTGYCNCRSCAGKWAGCATASGKRPRAKHTIAVDPRLIKLGTKVKIGKITYVAEDTGGAIKGRRIDIYYSSHRLAQRHGVKYQIATVYY